MGSEQREKTLIITYRYARKIAAPDLPRRNDAVDSSVGARRKGKFLIAGMRGEKERWEIGTRRERKRKGT